MLSRVSLKETARHSISCFALGCAVTLGAAAHQALAHTCIISPPNISLGTIEGALLHDITVPVTLTMKCVALDKNTPVKYCLMIAPLYPNVDANFNAGKHRILREDGRSSSDTPYIPFNFYFGGDKIWGAPLGRQGDYGDPIVGSTMQDTLTHVYSIPFTVTIGSGVGLQIPTGNYWNYFQIVLNYNYTNRKITDPNQLCTSTRPIGTIYEPTSMRVSATAKTSCTINVENNITFDKSYDLAAVKPAEGRLRVACNKDTTYQIGMDRGQHPAAQGRRAMQCQNADACGAGSILYDLYQDAQHSQIWGNDWGTRDVVKGKSDGTGKEYYPVYAQLYSGQQTPSAGTYTDAVVVTIRVDSSGGAVCE